MPMPRFAICNETYRDWPLPELCEHAAQCGYEGLEIAPFTLADDPSTLTEADAARAGATVRSAGLEPVGFHWLLAKPAGLHLTAPDPEVRRRTLEFARHLCRLCAALGGKVLVWGSPGQRTLPPGMTHSEAFAHARDLFAELAETAAGCGVRVALEPLPRKETDFVTSCAEGIALLEAVGHPALRLHLDAKAMSYEAEPIPDVIRRGAPWLEHFHANDPNLRGPGMGDLDFRPIAAMLEEIGYDGWVSVEVFDLSPGPETLAEESLAYLRRVWSELPPVPAR